MIKRVLIIILSLNLIGIIISCCEEDVNYKWIRVSTELIDNSGNAPVISNLDKINKNAFGIRVFLQDSILYYSYLPKFYNTAYATSCSRNYIASNTVKEIAVKTLYDFDGLKTKNSEISDYFTARLSQDIKSDYYSISEIVSKFNDRNNLHNADEHGNNEEAFDLFLMKQPNKIDTCQFQIEIKFTDEKSIKCLTRKLILF